MCSMQSQHISHSSSLLRYVQSSEPGRKRFGDEKHAIVQTFRGRGNNWHPHPPKKQRIIHAIVLSPARRLAASTIPDPPQQPPADSIVLGCERHRGHAPWRPGAASVLNKPIARHQVMSTRSICGVFLQATQYEVSSLVACRRREGRVLSSFGDLIHYSDLLKLWSFVHRPRRLAWRCVVEGWSHPAPPLHEKQSANRTLSSLWYTAKIGRQCIIACIHGMTRLDL